MFKNHHIFWDESHACYQVRTSDELFAVAFDDEEQKTIFEYLAFEEKENILDKRKHQEVIKTLQERGFPKEKILSVLSGLEDAGIFSEVKDNEQGVFSGKVAIIGASAISKKVSALLKDNEGISQEHYEDLNSILDPARLEKIIQSTDISVIDAQAKHPKFLKIFNEVTLDLNKPWLLIEGMEEGIGKIGPLFYGKETGCYECYERRQKSHTENLDYLEEYEKHLIETSKSTVVSSNPYHGALASMALTEVRSFLIGMVPGTYNKMIIVDFSNYEIKKHSLLKVPNCTTCKPKTNFDLAPWLEPLKV